MFYVDFVYSNALYREEVYGTQNNTDLYDSHDYISQGSLPITISNLKGLVYSEDRYHFTVPNGITFGHKNTFLSDVSVSNLDKRLQVAACCQIAIAFGTIMSIPSDGAIVQIANWLYNNAGTPSGKCATAAFHDAANNQADWRIKVVNTGYCSTTAKYSTIYDGVRGILESLAKEKCRRCADYKYGGKWRDELMATTYGSDPWMMECDEAEGYYKCKTNEHRDGECHKVHNVHDEM